MVRVFRPPVVAAAVLLLAAPASAQIDAEVPPLSIRVTGEARVTATPDQAEIDIAVITRGETAQRAAADNAERTARVLAAVKKLAATTSTARYTVHPEYRHPREGGEPQISGYVATNVVRVTMSELDDVGDLVDVAIGAGANRVQRIHFTLKNQQAVYAQALRQAATRARAEADALASALGLRIERVLSAVEDPTTIRPLVDTFRVAGMAAESTTTPVEPGTIEVDARVLVTFEVSSMQL